MKKTLSKKKILLLVLLLAVSILVIARKDSYYEIREYYAINMDETKYELTNQEELEIRQYFVAKQSELQNVYLRFYIENLVNLKGRIIISIEDSSGDSIVSSQMPLSHLTQTETADWTEFSMESDLEKGKTYTLVIKTKNVITDTNGSCSLYLSKNKSFLFGNLTLNGQANSRRLESTFKYNTYCVDDIVKMLFLLILSAIFVVVYDTGVFLSAGRRISKRWSDNALLKAINRKTGRILKWQITDGTRFLSRLIFVLTPLIAYYIMQTFSAYNLSSFIDQLVCIQGPLNLLIYTLILLVFYLITNRTKYAALFTVLTAYILGLANYFVWNFRGSPIVAADLASLKTATNVAGNYNYSPGLDAVWATVLSVAFVSVLLSLDTRKGLAFKKRIVLLLVTALLMTGTWGVFFHSTLMKKLNVSVSVWMPERDYAQNGSALSFLLTWTYYIVEKPAGYSEKAAEEITKGYISDSASGDSSKNNMVNSESSNNDDSPNGDSRTSNGTSEVKPNIIAIMNESFSDLAVDTDIETTEDYMPYIHNLTENTVKGHLYVSVLGGNTANSEFEFQTGNSISFFPARSIPYNSYVKTRTGSLTWTLKEQGYVGGKAIHPYYGDGWNRETVYPLLGFNDFITQDDFHNNTYVREFISDETDFERLISEYEEQRKTSSAPFYEFTVTMQNHGGYAGTHGLVDEKIQVTNPTNINDQVTQYLNLIRLSDEAFKNLTKYFEKVDEPTVIVMFGDHQPGFTDSVYDELMGQSTTKLGIEDTAKMYQVPYVIWANYDIREETLDMSANYLSSYLLNLTGNKMTGYNKYLLHLMKKVPVLSAICYIGDDGVIHASGEESEYSDLIREYQIVQYNNMFDTDNRIPDFFFLKK